MGSERANCKCDQCNQYYKLLNDVAVRKLQKECSTMRTKITTINTFLIKNNLVGMFSEFLKENYNTEEE